MSQAQASGLLTGCPAELAGQFAGLLWRDLMINLLVGVAERPNSREIAGGTRDAAHHLPATSSATEEHAPEIDSPSTRHTEGTADVLPTSRLPVTNRR
jgi:hypothetical protein